jgi:chemotaxis protein methyltransferase CheR
MTKKYSFGKKNYLWFCELIQKRTGIRVGDNRRDVLTHALKECAESMECADLDQFFSYLQDARTDSEVWNDLIKKVTIGETYFFRDSDYMEALYRNILPDLIARHQTDHTLRLWSAGCATGEEPYSLAILLRQILPDVDQWKILILATDINRHALKQGAAGRYRAWSFRETDPVIRSICFTSDGDTFTLDPAVRKMVAFAYHNLAEDNYPSPANQTSNLDLILCRNVTIYLPMSLIQDIANRFYQCLSNGGWLMVGPSEGHFEIYKQFQMLNFHGATVYQKVPHIPLFSGLWTTTSELMNRSEVRPQPDTLPVISSIRHAAPKTPVVDNISSAKIPQPPPADKLLIIPSGRPHTDSRVDRPRAGGRVFEPSGRKASKKKSEVDPEQHFPSPPLNQELGAAEWVALYHQGEAFMKQHCFDEARQCFLTCLAKGANSITAKHRMACLEANAGRLKEARKWAEQALHHDPLRSEVHYTLALIHEVQGELQEAINRLKKVIYLDPDFILAHFGLFHLYQRTGNPIKAERHRILTIHLASKLSPDTVLLGSDDLTAGQLLTMAQIMPRNQMEMVRGRS